MMVLNTCKWYQAVRLVMARRLVPSVTFLGQILKLTYLGQHGIYITWYLQGDFLYRAKSKERWRYQAAHQLP